MENVRNGHFPPNETTLFLSIGTERKSRRQRHRMDNRKLCATRVGVVVVALNAAKTFFPYFHSILLG